MTDNLKKGLLGIVLAGAIYSGAEAGYRNHFSPRIMNSSIKIDKSP